MGAPMCLNLLKSKDQIHSVIAYDVNATSLKNVEQAGAIPLSSLQELSCYAQEVDVILTMLPDGSVVNNVVTEVLDIAASSNAFNREITFIDCSTIGPVLSKELHEIVSSHSNNHFTMLDAPVSGGVKGATNASLTFMVGGSASALDKARPILSCMGKNIVHCGPAGMGIVAKLSNNLALASQMIGICEAMILGTSLGIDPNVLANVMNTSTAKCWSCEVNNPHPDVAAVTGSAASKGYEGGFGSSLMLKDIGLAVQAGDSAKVALPVGSLAKELYQLVESTGNGKKDFGIMLEFLRGNLGKKQ